MNDIEMKSGILTMEGHISELICTEPETLLITMELVVKVTLIGEISDTDVNKDRG